MPITLYDLAGADPALRFSPRCWRTRFALAHKGLATDTIAWRFRDAALLPEPNQGRVPVISDGDQVVCDSWAIAEYLEEQYPEQPSLFGGPSGRAHARFINEWVEAALLPAMLPMFVVDLFNAVDPGDQAYFRLNREARLGKSLEDAQAERETRVPIFQKLLAPIIATLSNQQWLGGVRPSYADHIVAAAFMWPRCVSQFNLLPREGPMLDWWRRILAEYDGLATRAARA